MIEEALLLYIDEMRLTLVGGDGGAREERRGSRGGRREGHRDGGDGRDGATSGVLFNGLFHGIGMKGVRQVLTLALFDFGQVRLSFVFN